MGGFAGKIRIPLQKARMSLSSPPSGGVGALEPQQGAVGPAWEGTHSFGWQRDGAEGWVPACVRPEDRQDDCRGFCWIYNRQGDKPVPPNTPNICRVIPRAAAPCLHFPSYKIKA